MIPGSGRSPGGGNDNPLQYSYLENPMTEESGGLQSMGLQKVGHNRMTNSFLFRGKEIFFVILKEFRELKFLSFLNKFSFPTF